jgi:hypothetical protein
MFFIFVLYEHTLNLFLIFLAFLVICFLYFFTIFYKKIKTLTPIFLQHLIIIAHQIGKINQNTKY